MSEPTREVPAPDRAAPEVPEAGASPPPAAAAEPRADGPSHAPAPGASPARPEGTAPAEPGGAVPAGHEEGEPPAATPGSADPSRPRRRRGSRGGRNRSRASARADGTAPAAAGAGPDRPSAAAPLAGPAAGAVDRRPDDLPDRHGEGRPSAEVAERALVRRPRIGDTIAPPSGAVGAGAPAAPAPAGDRDGDHPADSPDDRAGAAGDDGGAEAPRRRRRGGRGRGAARAAGGAGADHEEATERPRGRERKGRPVGRYLMCVHVAPEATQIAVLEGRSLIEHYVSRPADDTGQIHGNVYLGRVQNVLPGMEAAFVDIGTPKNAVLYRGDVHYDAEDVEEGGAARIEQILKPRQQIICQVTKNPIGTKGARLTQEVSLPGRFVVLIPNSATYGISKRLADDERKRLRGILDDVKPDGHGIIVRTAAEGCTREELERDVVSLLRQWQRIEQQAAKASAPALLHREPDMAVRIIREEFNAEYRGVVIDDAALFEEVRDYVAGITPELADRVERFDPAQEPLPLFERHHVHEQLHKALDRKVWLPSGGSLIIERTEALTVIDVNTGKNVGTSSLEETVFRNNLEAAEEVARQLRLRDIGGIIVIDFIDMEIKPNRDEVVRSFREALARDKTRTQVFDISELGLVEMTRKRIGEGLLESFSGACPTCGGRGIVLDPALLD